MYQKLFQSPYSEKLLFSLRKLELIKHLLYIYKLYYNSLSILHIIKLSLVFGIKDRSQKDSMEFNCKNSVCSSKKK